jgi:hypothetical protein
MNIKTLAGLLVGLSVVPMTMAQPPTPTETNKSAPATTTDTKKAAPKADAKAKAAPVVVPAKKDDKNKKAEEMGKIDGMTLPRGTGFLGVQIVNGVFKITNYNAKKKPAAADFTRIVLRWNAPYQKAPERTQLGPTGLGTFSSEKIVKPPHTFRLSITLFRGDGDDAPAENLSLDFSA